MHTRGIDYGLGITNKDKKTNIRFGVLPQNQVLQAWCDSSEPYYGEVEAECECGHIARGELETIGDLCEECGEYLSLDFLEPVSFFVEDEEYLAECGEDGDIFIMKSPYITYAQFCSPCAPGACYLLNPCDPNRNNMAYCFGPDWFEDGKAPYPIYRIKDGKLMNPEFATKTEAP